MSKSAFKCNLGKERVLLEGAEQESGRAGSLLAVAVDCGTEQTTREGDGEELTAETSTSFFIFIVPCVSACCSGGRAAQFPPASPRDALPPAALPAFLWAGTEKEFPFLDGSRPSWCHGREGEGREAPGALRRLAGLCSACLCLHGWNFPGSPPSATTTTLQIPRNATHENAFLAHS